MFDQINAHCRRYAVDVLVPTDTRCTRMLCRHNGELEVGIYPLPAPDVFTLLYNKWTFSQYLDKVQVPQPPTRLVCSEDDCLNLDLKFPVIVKPTASENSEGIFRFDQRNALLEHVRTYQVSSQNPLLVQHFVNGYMMGMNFLADHGDLVAWAIRRRLPGDWSTMDFFIDEGMVEHCRRIAAGCGYHGVADLDMMVDPDTQQYYFIDMNPRFWGSLLWSVFSGVNFPYLGCLMSQGIDPRPGFTPATGPCTYLGLSSRKLIRQLVTGRFTPPQFNQASRLAWLAAHTDPLPHLWARFMH